MMEVSDAFGDTQRRRRSRQAPGRTRRFVRSTARACPNYRRGCSRASRSPSTRQSLRRRCRTGTCATGARCRRPATAQNTRRPVTNRAMNTVGAPYFSKKRSNCRSRRGRQPDLARRGARPAAARRGGRSRSRCCRRGWRRPSRRRSPTAATDARTAPAPPRPAASSRQGPARRRFRAAHRRRRRRSRSARRDRAATEAPIDANSSAVQVMRCRTRSIHGSARAQAVHVPAMADGSLNRGMAHFAAEPACGRDPCCSRCR